MGQHGHRGRRRRLGLFACGRRSKRPWLTARPISGPTPSKLGRRPRRDVKRRVEFDVTGMEPVVACPHLHLQRMQSPSARSKTWPSSRWWWARAPTAVSPTCAKPPPCVEGRKSGQRRALHRTAATPFGVEAGHEGRPVRRVHRRGLHRRPSHLRPLPAAVASWASSATANAPYSTSNRNFKGRIGGLQGRSLPRQPRRSRRLRRGRRHRRDPDQL